MATTAVDILGIVEEDGVTFFVTRVSGSSGIYTLKKRYSEYKALFDGIKRETGGTRPER